MAAIASSLSWAKLFGHEGVSAAYSSWGTKPVSNSTPGPLPPPLDRRAVSNAVPVAKEDQRIDVKKPPDGTVGNYAKIHDLFGDWLSPPSGLPAGKALPEKSERFTLVTTDRASGPKIEAPQPVADAAVKNAATPVKVSLYGGLIAGAFYFEHETLSVINISDRIRKTAGNKAIPGFEKLEASLMALLQVFMLTEFKIEVLNELVQNDQFYPAHGRHWKRPFRKANWAITTKMFQESRSSLPKAQRDTDIALKEGVDVLAYTPIYEMDATPLYINERSRKGKERATVNSDASKPPFSPSSTSPTHSFSNKHYPDDTGEWQVIQTQYGPVPFPQLARNREQIQTEAFASSSTSGFATNSVSTVRPACARKDPAKTAQSMSSALYSPPKPSASDATPTNPSGKTAKENAENTSEEPTEPAIASEGKGTGEDVECSAPPSPLLAAADESTLFTTVSRKPSDSQDCNASVVQLAQQPHENDRGSKGVQEGHSGASTEKNSNSQHPSHDSNGSDEGTNEDDADDQDRRRKRKRFPPGDDHPSENQWLGPKFICIYHRFNPQQYGASHRRYLVCQGPGFRYISELV